MSNYEVKVTIKVQLNSEQRNLIPKNNHLLTEISEMTAFSKGMKRTGIKFFKVSHLL